jgi:hypothetical protein
MNSLEQRADEVLVALAGFSLRVLDRGENRRIVGG